MSCKADNCTRPANGNGSARGYCSMHYQRVMKHGTPEANGYTRRDGKCEKQGCAGQQHAKGLCAAHYKQRWATEYREPVQAGVLPDSIRAMIRDRRRRGIPAEGVLFQGEAA